LKKIICNHLEEISQSAKLVIDLCKDLNVWVFKGELGAGKTTLIKAIAELMGVSDLVTSPTFSIVNEYEGREGRKIFHFDFYRIDDPLEALEIGLDDYFYSGSYCFVEWSERIPAFIPEEFAFVELHRIDRDKREIMVKIVKDGSRNGVH
jgi:tRNA threonylcarbamoyladenosine biosynthesis protein TsaE